MFTRFQKCISRHSFFLSSRHNQSFCTSKTYPRIYIFHSLDIYWNLATEEYLYENLDKTHPTLLLYRNNKSVVIGRHQNPWKECDIQSMREDDINFCRRKSGGGAVYHDLGNSCYSFLTPVHPDVLPLNVKVDNNKVLIRALENLGIPCELNARNDICYNEKKVSGSAYQASLGKRDGTGRKTLHHGTMLLNADLPSLRKYLNPKKEKIVSKGVESVRSPVINLIEAKPDLTHEIFCNAVQEEFIRSFPGKEYSVIEYKQEEIEQIQRIADIYNELITWEWQFEKTPEFTNEVEETFDWGKINIFMKVAHGAITESRIDIEPSYTDFADAMREVLHSRKIVYDEHGIKELLQPLKETFKDNILYSNIIYDLENWLPKAI